TAGEIIFVTQPRTGPSGPSNTVPCGSRAACGFDNAPRITPGCVRIEKGERSMPFHESSIRPATVNDARRIAESMSQAGRLPITQFFRAPVDKWETSWKELLETRSDIITLVACGPSGEVVGFASGGAERAGNLPCDGELHAIYLLQAMRGRGLGTF